MTLDFTLWTNCREWRKKKVIYRKQYLHMYSEVQRQKRLKYVLASQKQFSKSLVLLPWILRMSKILLHPRSWEPNSTLNVPYQQFYTLRLKENRNIINYWEVPHTLPTKQDSTSLLSYQGVHLQTYWVLL